MSIKKKRERRDFGETINRWELIAIEIYANSTNRDNKFMNRLFSRLLLGIYKKKTSHVRIYQHLVNRWRATRRFFFDQIFPQNEEDFFFGC